MIVFSLHIYEHLLICTLELDRDVHFKNLNLQRFLRSSDKWGPLSVVGLYLTSSRSWAEILTEYEKVSSSSSSTNCWGFAVHTLIWEKIWRTVRPGTSAHTAASLSSWARRGSSPAPLWSACTGWCSRWARAGLSSLCSWTCCSPAACGQTQRCWTPSSQNPEPHLQKNNSHKMGTKGLTDIKKKPKTLNKQDKADCAHHLSPLDHPLPLCS